MSKIVAVCAWIAAQQLTVWQGKRTIGENKVVTGVTAVCTALKPKARLISAAVWSRKLLANGQSMELGN